MATPNGYLRVLSGVLFGLIVLVAALNVVVDPYLAHRLVDLEDLRPYRVRLISRVAKAEMLERADCEVAIIGTSRAQIGLDPEYAGWGGESVCNLALAGAGLTELEHVFDHALAHPGIEHIVFEVDRFDRRPAHEDFPFSRFNPGLNELEYAASLLFGASATRASYRALRDLRRERRAPNTARGLTRPDWPRQRGSVREAFLWALGKGRSAAPANESDYDSRGAERIAVLVARARTRGVAVSLVVMPRHALSIAFERERYGAAHQDEWRRDLVLALDGLGERPAALWDFMSADGRAAEPVPMSEGATQDEMRWHWDAVHVRREFGNLLIDRILSDQAENPGLLGAALDARNVDAHLAEFAGQVSRYAERNPDQLETIRAALDSGA